jgi:hypothetical protein
MLNSALEGLGGSTLDSALDGVDGSALGFALDGLSLDSVCSLISETQRSTA